MATPTIPLTQVSVLSELILRGGNATDPRSRQSLRDQYVRGFPALYPDVTSGLSCLFRPGATLDELAREGAYRNGKLSFALVGPLTRELASSGYGAVLYVTPTHRYPDHHTLTLVRNGQIERTLRDDALDALLRAVHVVDNPYQGRSP